MGEANMTKLKREKAYGLEFSGIDGQVEVVARTDRHVPLLHRLHALVGHRVGNFYGALWFR